MNIEVGKAYRTRNGEKVVITACVKNLAHPLKGSCEWMTCDDTWMGNGDYHVSLKGHPLDLISEWIEPVELKIEAGKFYKSRGDEKRVVVWINEDRSYISLLVDVETGEVYCDFALHHPDGFILSDKMEHREDIIGPWIDPPKPLEMWGNVYKSCLGGVRVYGLHDTKEEAVQAGCNPQTLIRTSKFVEVLPQ